MISDCIIKRKKMGINPENTAARIRRKLTAAFTPILLEIVDESASHAGHIGNPGGDSETHFRVKIISTVFAGQNKVARHRAVYAVLADDMKEGGIHALALDLCTGREE